LLTDTRIIFLVSSMHTGGAERVAANLVNAWASSGRQVTLVVTYSRRGECHYSLDERVELLYLSDIAQAKGRGMPGYLRRFLALRGVIKARRPAVVVSFLPNVNVAAVLASVGLRVPVIVSERIHPPCYPLGLVWEWLRRLTYPWAERVVMQTEEGLGWLKQVIPSAHGVVIPNPVCYPLPAGDPVVAVADHVPAGRKLLLAVGRLNERKQFDRLLEVFSRLMARHAGWDLAILGEGPERARLQDAIARLGLESRVRMPGRVGNVGDWYARADLYVMSSRFEGFPNTLAEAMAHGCAAVSYDCDTGPRDIIRHEVDGLLVRPVGDVAALAEALDSLMGDEVRRTAMGGLASEVRERFANEKIDGQWENLFDELLHTKG
jgi:glycosyltransferase involved in cell wall biosynthesis